MPLLAVNLIGYGLGSGSSQRATGVGSDAPGNDVLDDAKVAQLVDPYLRHGRPRAASVALLQAGCAHGIRGPLAAACFRLAAASDHCYSMSEPDMKRRKVKSVPS